MQTLHIAFDDTDSRSGRCTTHLAFKIMVGLKRIGAELVDYPLLVRLNPNIPWKTRGNGAVCLRVRVPEAGRAIAHVIQAVEEGSAIGNGANPGVAFYQGDGLHGVVEEFSGNAMCNVMSRKMAESVAAVSGVEYRTFGNGQGLVGSLGAIGCLMADCDYTYELIAYRKPENCGRPRVVDEQKVIKFSEATYPNTFNNYDKRHGRVLIAPHGPDPVYFGIRGESPEVVSSALQFLQPGEELGGWMIFRTNQGTNMHLRRELKLAGVKAYTCGYVRGRVTVKPRVIEGGHAIFAIEQEGTEMPVAVYEPTGLSGIAAELEAGDVIEIGCGVRKGTIKHPKILNVEYLNVLELVPAYESRNPMCKACGKRMKSEGREKGYQCDRCKFRDRNARKILIPRERDLKIGMYIPTPKAHRHLTKPMQRYGLEKKNFHVEEVAGGGLSELCKFC